MVGLRSPASEGVVFFQLSRALKIRLSSLHEES